jgi:hypothetical protein
MATSISIGEGGIGLESSGGASVGDILEMEFNLPEIKELVKVSGSLRLKEPSGRTSIEFIKPPEVSRNAIREFVCGKIKE